MDKLYPIFVPKNYDPNTFIFLFFDLSVYQPKRTAAETYKDPTLL